MKKFLKVLGWICIPYIMIFVFWKRLQKPGRIAGIIYAIIALIIAISSGHDSGNTDNSTFQPAAVASTTPATTDTNTVENSKTAAQQKADEEAAAKKKVADDAAAAQKKAQEEAAAKAQAQADAKAKADAIAQAQAAARTNAKSIDYAQLKKDPDKFSGQYAKYTGEIVQILEDGDNTVIRLAVTKDDFGYNFGDIVFVKYQGTTDYVEKDIVTVYGTLDGSYTYKSQAGWDISVPSMSADFFDKVGTAQN